MNDKLDNYIDGVKNLPVAPTIMVKLVSLFQSPAPEVDDIVNLLCQDPSLSAEVLRHSNSAYYGHDEPVMDIFQAITQVGFYDIYRTAVVKLGSQALLIPAGVPGAVVEKLWRHSSLAAVTASVIARSARENDGLAFTAGLLHDIGKVVLTCGESARYVALAKEVGTGGSMLQRAEVARFGFGHGEVGARLLHRWGLPKEISVPVRRHHEVEGVESFERICAVVGLANIMAHVADGDAPEKPYHTPEAFCAMGTLKLREDDLAKLLETAQREIKRMAGMF